MGVLSNIREHREELVGFDDLLNYAFLIRGAQTHEPAVVLLKDGALLRAWYFQGPDLDYAAEEELERLSLLVSQAFRHCGDGWMLHVHSVRRPCPGYLPPGAFRVPRMPTPRPSNGLPALAIMAGSRWTLALLKYPLLGGNGCIDRNA